MQVIRSFAVACAGLGIVLMAGCGGGDELARVNGQKVTQQEFDAYLKFKRVPVTEKDGEKYARALDQYLERTALAAAIEESMADNKDIDSDLIQAELAEFRKEQLISRYFEQYLKDAVSDAAVSNYYNAHADDYSERRVHVAHILVRTSRAMGEAERKVQLTKIQEAAAKVASGMDFAKAAEAYSEDTVSAKKGGDLGWLKEGSIDPKFTQAAFELPAGQVSEPIETPFGYHLIKVIEAPVIKKQPLEAVQGDIRYRLRSEAKEAELKRLMGEISIKKKGS